jgi:DNA modification methylase
VGSGTTIIAAEMTGRRCFAIEISPGYVDVAVMRWQNVTGLLATHEATGQTFASLKQDRVAEATAAAGVTSAREYSQV